MKKLYTALIISTLSFALSAQTVWINEIHYDNSGTDVDEGIEIAGPAGTDLTGWTVVCYNGNGGGTYANITLNGSLADQTNGFGTIWFPVAVNGLQNGNPDGVALVNSSTEVIQFLSYGGTFAAADGPANGITSTDIGVAQSSSTAVGYTLQLQGTGTTYTDFTWAANIAATRGASNEGQTFGEDIFPPVWTTGYPKMGKMFDNKGELLVSMDEPGTAYYIVMADGAAAPTSEEVKAGVNYGSETVLVSGSVTVVEGNTEYSEIISGADPETTYNIWVVAEDNMTTPNLQASPSMVTATTTAARTLTITSPVADGTYYAGEAVTFSWTSSGIDNVIIGGYDQDNAEEFFITDDNDEPYIIDASLGQFVYTLPNGLGSNLVDIRIYDADDITFFSTVSPVNLLDEIDPSLVWHYPRNGEIYVPLDVQIFAFFDEDLYPGTGSVYLRKAEDNSIVEEFDIAAATTGGAIELTDEIITIRPSVSLEEATLYYIEMDAGIVVDYDGNPFAGITGSATWSFKSFTDPTPVLLDDFEDGDLAPWTAFSASGDTKTWEAYSGTARLNGYNSGDLEHDWLISPPLDGSGYEDLFVVFDLWYNYGDQDETNHLKLYYSTDYDGNTANIATATWTELEFNIPSSSSTTEPSGLIPVDPGSYPVYFAFEYYYNPGSYRDWRVDNFVLGGVALPGSDASLSDLLVDGVTVEGFAPETTSYTVVLPAGTVTVPAVTYTTADNLAEATVTPATDLTGDAAARTTTVEVTSANGISTRTYSIQFDPVLAVADLATLRAATDFDRIYQVTGEVVITALNSFNGQKFIEDESAAIYIYDSEGIITTAYNEGDGLTGVTGKLKLNYDMLQLLPYSDPGATSSTGNTIEPQVVALADFVASFEDYEAELIRIEGVSFTAADGTATFANSQNYTFTVGEEEAILRTHFWNTSVTGEVIPYMADVTGPALWDYSNPKIVPRYIEDINIYSSVSALSDLMVDGTTVDGFDAATLAYTVTLESGASAVPAVTATPAEENGSVTITPATNVTGTETERTTTIEVVSHDQTSTTVYTIVFEVATSVDASLADKVNIYPVPVQFELTIENISAFKSLEIMDMAGSRVISTNTEGQPEYRIDVSPLPAGIYFLRLRTETGVITRKFIKK
jgi:hypothetical protein